ncbi:MAG: DUF4326 domain-containing protein, partial [Candidatus Nitrosopolaris sp.]
MTGWVVHVRKHRYDVYVGRFSRWIRHDMPGSSGYWGNPFSIEKDSNGKEISGSREEVVAKHKEWLLSREELPNSYGKHGTIGSNKEVNRELIKLRGKILGCWCSPKLCYGDILAETNSIYQQIWWRLKHARLCNKHCAESKHNVKYRKNTEFYT